MFSQDELDQARAAPIAERHGAGLKRSGRELIGPCPHCGGVDRFSILLTKNIWNCRGCGTGGDAIAFEMHFHGYSFVDAMRALIGQHAGTPTRRQPTSDEIAAREAREAKRRREEAEEAARNASSVARILARLQPVTGTPGEDYLANVRKVDVNHPAIRRVLEDVTALGWCERTCFWQPDPNKPLHEFHGQWFGAIVGILTDPITGERTGGITRTYLRDGRKLCRAKSLGGVGRLGIIRLSPDDEVETGLHLGEAIETSLSAMTLSFIPMWAAGSTTTMADFPVLTGIEFLTLIADHDEPGLKAARQTRQRWADVGRETATKISRIPGEDINDIIQRRARA